MSLAPPQNVVATLGANGVVSVSWQAPSSTYTYDYKSAVGSVSVPLTTGYAGTSVTGLATGGAPFALMVRSNDTFFASTWVTSNWLNPLPNTLNLSDLDNRWVIYNKSFEASVSCLDGVPTVSLAQAVTGVTLTTLSSDPATHTTRFRLSADLTSQINSMVTLNITAPNTGKYTQTSGSKFWYIKADKPSAPTITSVTTSENTITVFFNPPEYTGGVPLRNTDTYQIELTDSNNDKVGYYPDNVNSYQFTGLKLGMTYALISLRAINQGGVPGAFTNYHINFTPKGTQTLTLTLNESQWRVNEPATATATSNIAGLQPLITSSDPAICTVEALTGGQFALRFHAAGPVTLTATHLGTAAYHPATASQTITVLPAYSDLVPTGVTATADQQTRVCKLAWTPPAGPDSPSSYSVMMLSGGNTYPLETVTGTSGSFAIPDILWGKPLQFVVQSVFTPGPQQVRYSLAAFSNTVLLTLPNAITFTDPGARTAGDTLTVSPVSSSGLPVTLRAEPADLCAITGPLGGPYTLDFKKAGTLVLTASQAGNEAYGAAAEVAYTVTVKPRQASLVPPYVFVNGQATRDGRFETLRDAQRRTLALVTLRSDLLGPDLNALADGARVEVNFTKARGLSVLMPGDLAALMRQRGDTLSLTAGSAAWRLPLADWDLTALAGLLGRDAWDDAMQLRFTLNPLDTDAQRALVETAAQQGKTLLVAGWRLAIELVLEDRVVQLDALPAPATLTLALPGDAGAPPTDALMTHAPAQADAAAFTLLPLTPAADGAGLDIPISLTGHLALVR